MRVPLMRIVQVGSEVRVVARGRIALCGAMPTCVYQPATSRLSLSLSLSLAECVLCMYFMCARVCVCVCGGGQFCLKWVFGRLLSTQEICRWTLEMAV